MLIELNSNILTIQNKVSKRYIEFINEKTIRLYTKKNSASLVKLNDKEEKCNIVLLENEIKFGDYQILINDNLKVKVIKNNYVVFEETDDVIENKEITIKSQMSMKLKENDYVYGLGDKAAFLNKRGYEFISYNTDDPSAHNEQYKSLYKSINYLLVNTDQEYYGILYPSTYKTYFNIGKAKKDVLNISSYKGEDDYFLFLGTIEQVTEAYSTLVGKPLFTTLKMLGNQQSRWSYMSEKEVLDVADNYKKHQIPLDFIHLDIDYMDNFKDYSYNKEVFPSLSDLADKLDKNGVGVVTIIDAGVKEEKGYNVYDYLVNNNLALTLDNEVYVNEVWPGRSIFPDFMKKETQDYFKSLTKDWINTTKVKGIWCDMNEPASFKGPLPDNVESHLDDGVHLHEEFHNVYGENMVKGISQAFKEMNKRPYVITRACFATSSQYTICWNGDNQSLWSHLNVSLPQVMSMNLSSFPLDGVDVGGFSCDCTEELLTRFIEANMFSPFLRNHSAQGTKYQEPWMMSDRCCEIYKKMVDTRYKFIPYLYDVARESHLHGYPIIRPLFYNYPFNEKVKEMNDEIMIGDSLILCPILSQGSRSRSIYLPEGKWINYFTREVYEGDKEYLLHLEMDEVGLFVKAGSIIPSYKGLTSINKEKIDTLYFDARYGNGSYINYEDDGDSLNYLNGEYNLYKITKNDEDITLEVLKHEYKSPYKKIIVETENGSKEFTLA